MSQAGGTSSLEASNLIDAVASGEDLDTVLQTNRKDTASALSMLSCGA